MLNRACAVVCTRYVDISTRSGKGEMKRPPPEQSKSVLDLWHAACEASAILIGALLVAGASGAYHCHEYAKCKDTRHCILATRLRPLEVGCAFINTVSIEADVLYNGTVGMLYSSTRSVCSPGERLYTDANGGVECAPKRAWPNALNTEIMNSEGGTYHDRACGAWISAGNYVFNPDANSLTSIMTPKYWSFYDSDTANAAVMRAEASAYSFSRLQHSDMGKFYSACQTTVLGGNSAIRASAIAAYRYLLNGMPTPNTREMSLRAVGWLASHHCEGTVLIATHLSFGKWWAKSHRGSAFLRYELAQALFAMGEPASVQSNAEQAMQTINANAKSPSYISDVDFGEVLMGAVGNDLANVRIMGDTPELAGFLTLGAATNGQAMVDAFLRGTAARCALSIDGSLSVKSVGSVTDPNVVSEGLKRTKATHPRATSFNRLAVSPNHSPMDDEINEDEIINASIVTWAQIASEPYGDPVADCTALARFLFPDRIEQERFDLMVSDSLYNRLETVTYQIRAAVMHVVQTDRMKDFLDNVNHVVSNTQQTEIRIPGAPRNSWAGAATELPDGNLDSSDSALLMAVKQSRAVFLHRINSLVIEDAHTCDGPSVKEALTANAYIYFNNRCSYILLGLLRMPFADERYDDVSLASRLGWIIGHELSHNTLSTHLNLTQLQLLLPHYQSSVLREAIADVISALAVIHAGLASAKDICEHVSQLWCARTPFGFKTSSSASHPGPNERGDKLCATLRDFGYDTFGVESLGSESSSGFD